ncbi:MAG: YdeI/OmpD-associated family protein [Myxococcaceae bacterium]|nr:YdeI/OmpD-associated family protein [Myxococcaceae bacterium]
MPTITPKNAAEWRKWLQKNHTKETEVWVIYVKSAHGRSMTWSDAVDEALCFGWIDTTSKRIDDKHYQQRFTRRRPGSTWSAINVAKVKKLEAEGKMSEAGLKEVELAKKNGTWAKASAWKKAADMPPELEKALNAKSRAAYEALAPGYQNLYRRFVGEAKQEVTRLKRAKLAARFLVEGHKIPFGVPQGPT